MEEGTPVETGPDGEPYFALPPPKKNRAWPWVVLILVCLIVVPFVVFLYVREGPDKADKGEPFGARSERFVDVEGRYPSVSLVDGLLDEPTKLAHPDGAWWNTCVAFVPDPAGVPALLYGAKGKHEWHGPSLKSGRRFSTELPVTQCVATGNVAAPYAAIVGGIAGTQWIEGLSAEGKTVWRWTAEETNHPQWLSSGFAAQGPDGCVVGAGSGDGIVGLKADGTVSWRWPPWTPLGYLHVYEVSTHSSLAGWVASASGHLVVERAQPANTPEIFRDLRTAIAAEKAHVTHVTLFPGPDSRPAVVCAGTADTLGDTDWIVARIDLQGSGSEVPRAKQVWRARPPSEVKAIALIDAPRRPRLFVLTTEGRALLLLDEDGVLRARLRLPRMLYEGGPMPDLLAAGRLGQEGWAIAVALEAGTYVYPVHPEKLPVK